jgi:hypothetical protein
MKKLLLFLVAIFVIGTSFAPPVKKAKRCGPNFSIYNNSSSSIAFIRLYNSSGTYDQTFTGPISVINTDQLSGFDWNISAQSVAKVPYKPIDLLVKNHYTGAKLNCYNAGPGEIFYLNFATGCDWIDIVFSDNTDICGIWP